MKGYGSFCPVAKGAEILTERWTLLVLRELLLGSCHFNHLTWGGVRSRVMFSFS
jgi:DNA-binding HxlR family transcriptional regulator